MFIIVDVSYLWLELGVVVLVVVVEFELIVVICIVDIVVVCVWFGDWVLWLVEIMLLCCCVVGKLGELCLNVGVL